MRARRRPAPPRGRAWAAYAWLVLVVFAVPAALGAATGPLLGELGAAMTEHVCKCGMPAGKCGCPECERLAQELSRERLASPVPSLQRYCADGAPGLPFGALPNAVLGATSTALVPIPRGERLAIASCSVPLPRSADEPPTPPPRTASV